MDPAVFISGHQVPTGGAFDILFSFDTTGSMSYILDEVKGRLIDIIKRLQSDIRGIPLESSLKLTTVTKQCFNRFIDKCFTSYRQFPAILG